MAVLSCLLRSAFCLLLSAAASSPSCLRNLCNLWILADCSLATQRQPRLQLSLARFAPSSQRWRSPFSGIDLHKFFRK